MFKPGNFGPSGWYEGDGCVRACVRACVRVWGGGGDLMEMALRETGLSCCLVHPKLHVTAIQFFFFYF